MGLIKRVAGPCVRPWVRCTIARALLGGGHLAGSRAIGGSSENSVGIRATADRRSSSRQAPLARPARHRHRRPGSEPTRWRQGCGPTSGSGQAEARSPLGGAAGRRVRHGGAIAHEASRFAIPLGIDPVDRRHFTDERKTWSYRRYRSSPRFSGLRYRPDGHPAGRRDTESNDSYPVIGINSLLPASGSLIANKFSLFRRLGNSVAKRSSESRGALAISSPKSANFPVFSRGTGNQRAETGSLMTASSARGPINLNKIKGRWGVTHKLTHNGLFCGRMRKSVVLVLNPQAAL